MVALLPLLLAGCPRGDGLDSVTDADADTDTDTDTDADADTDTDTDTEPALVINDYLKLDTRPKNVIVLSWDTLRHDHVNALGYTLRDTTPTLDRVFDDGVGFRNHSSCSSWTFPSFTCALTGRDQFDNLFWPYELNGDLPEAPNGFPLAPLIFQDLGYHTGLYSASGFLGISANMYQGYDEGYGEFDQDGEETKAEEILDDAIEFLDGRLAERDTPFYVHIHFMEPHMPWIPGEDYLGWEEELDPVDADFDTQDGTKDVWQSFSEGALSADDQALLLAHMLARYDGELRLADDQTLRLFDYLEANGFWEDTILVFLSDHGEEFFEHENFNHGYNQFAVVTESLAGFYQPGNLRQADVEELTWHPDLLPTLFSILDLNPAGSIYYDGFTGNVVGTDVPHTRIFTNTYRVQKTHQAVDDGHVKLMLRWDDNTQVQDGPLYFFDRDADWWESNNLYADPESPPDGVAKWWGELCPKIQFLDEHEPNTAAVVASLKNGECD